MRRTLTRLHRWLGLATAAFLFVAGLTGAIIAWDHELDAWLNPQLFHAPTRGALRSALALADQVERDDPRIFVNYMPLHVERDHALTMSVSPRVDAASGAPHALDFDQVFVDPNDGALLG